MQSSGLYDFKNEHDACGLGFIVNIDGKKSHSMINDGITILCNLEHRGAVGGDHKTGDGAGMMLQIPHRFFKKALNFDLPAEGTYGVGFLFLPPESDDEARKMVERVVSKEGGKILGWRKVPVNPDALGDFARNSMPAFWQVFLLFDQFKGEALERKFFILRKCLENEANRRGWSMNDFYVSSLSSRTVVYKGMFVSTQFKSFYPDLNDPAFESALVMVHQRYSTNTFPSWSMAQPFRFIAHNGEINTLRGNINKIQDREYTLSSPLIGSEIKKIFPIVNPNASDSACFDNVFELLVMGGRSMEHAMMMMVPEAFGLQYHISLDLRAFYEYHMTIMDPWDGPAALIFSDGIKVGAYLDRNGLRPGRYVITRSGKVILASETGVLPVDPADVLEKGRLMPGKMFLVDTRRKRVIKDKEIKASVSRWKPYRRWLAENKIELKGLFQIPYRMRLDKERLLERQKVFGYTLEDIKMILLPMAQNAQEPVGSMGNDAALAVLSQKPQLLYNYFKQRFAQVTNPPIDPYRENLVMSLSSWVGRQKNILEETPEHCRQLKLSHPVLTNEDLERLRGANIKGLKVTTVPMLFEAREGSLENGLEQLCLAVEKKVDAGYSVVIMSDRNITEHSAPIPALLATSTVHHYLVRKAKRHLTALILETGEAREVHHFATLISFGASGINPYLIFETIYNLKHKGYLPEDISLETASMHFITAVNKGLLKVMSKMGISTLRSYRHAETFEAIGLSKEFVEKYFPGTFSPIGGIGLRVVEEETLRRHAQAFNKSDGQSTSQLPSGGDYSYRRQIKEHLMSPEAVVLLQRAVREGNYELFKQYTREVDGNSRKLCTLRGLFKIKKRAPVPLDEVEEVDSIVKRFVTSAMSFGSISKETHETLALAMNRLGAKSNSGEGGEDEERFKPLPNGDSLNSKVKQVASARFGVTINYLINAEELQIKIAQGAKPGEGGQLPGFKVNSVIARVRHSTPGVMLISPPPHHDIYSIEDLAQLISDLKHANRQARVSVKLVSEMGVGTVAAGVAKAKADMVLISGYDGGTGASPLSSIKHAGSVWEIGLAETQQVLMRNNLRDRIRVQVDGQLRTGRDVVIAALLGAEEFGFATAALISLGCVMMRKCHLNTCPVGVATQDERLRKRFKGKPEHVMNFMRFIAREVREYMAEAGFRTIDEMVGRTDLLDVDEALHHYKSRGLDLSNIFYDDKQFSGRARYCIGKQEHDFSRTLDDKILPQVKEAFERKKPVRLEMPIHNFNRTTGATLSSEVAKRFGSEGLPDNTIRIRFHGSAGQSFGAFLARGVTFELEGDANDYVGKGLSGGRIIIRPPKKSAFLAQNNVISGNVNLFGATGGEVFINGMAGERFCVRNSGAVAVVEGVGDHGCEYMTGGRVIVLGKTGVNFAAGMSGGIAFVLDENQLFDTRCNLEMVDIEGVSEEDDIRFLKKYISEHFEYTKSRLADHILQNWEEYLPFFVKVMPIDYRRALERMEELRFREEGKVSVTEEVYT
ncbi:MAG: glutamate synthase large subunit [Calditrichaeota bacterium]|nr:glutamate synthase large subunit [Calditrichota bacterium]